MPLNNTQHNLLLQRKLTRVHGEFVTHYAVRKCSCQGAGEHPKPNCAVCGGSGRAYTTGRRLKGLIAGINSQDKALLQAGLAMPGDMTFSPDLAGPLAMDDYDVVRLDYGQPFEGDILIRGTNDTLSYVPATIIGAERHDPVTGDRTIYRGGLDYTLSGRVITWTNTGIKPAVGQSYAVTYLAFYDWVVYPGVTLQRVKRGTFLGQRVLLRKRHLAGIKALIPDEVDPTVQYLTDDLGNLLEAS